MNIQQAIEKAFIIPTLTTQEERECLARLSQEVKAGSRIVEVGSLYGGITAILALANPLSKIITIDNFSWHPDNYPVTSAELVRENMQSVGVNNVTVLHSDSIEAGKNWNQSIDLLWIDGGHSYEFVHTDLIQFGAYAEVIALHDYKNPYWDSVEKAVNDFIAIRPEFYIDEVKGQVVVLRKKNLQNVFTEIYKKNLWANDETRSGGGATLEQTEKVRKELPIILKKFGIKKLLDVGCGDFNWMSKINFEGVDVIGCDIVAEMMLENHNKYSEIARFDVLDITKDKLPKVDAILCRIVLFHLSNENIQKALDNFKKSGTRYIIMTTHRNVDVNAEIKDGKWRRVNLEIAPFNMPEPLQFFYDGEGQDGILAIWKNYD